MGLFKNHPVLIFPAFPSLAPFRISTSSVALLLGSAAAGCNPTVQHGTGKQMEQQMLFVSSPAF